MIFKIRNERNILYIILIYLHFVFNVTLARIHFLYSMQYTFNDFCYFYFKCLLFCTIHNCRIVKEIS